MKKNLITLMIVLLAGLAAQAATKYGINVGGTEVTSDNCNNVTSQYITEGTVKYNPSTNTLTLTNVYVWRNSSDNYALHNRSCPGLKVEFVGNCTLVSYKARAVRFDKSGELVATSGSYVSLYGSDDGVIYFHNNSSLTIKGPGTFYIQSSDKKAAIQADNGSDCLAFYNARATIKSPQGALADINEVEFYFNCYVNLKATGSSSYPVVRNVSTWSTYSSNRILFPKNASFSSSSKSVVVSGSTVYNDDIFVSNDNVVLLNSYYFPDANFRDYLLSLYPNGYLNSNDVSNLTSLNCSGKGISKLKGIELLTALKELRCYNNSISSLDLSSSNRNLTYLDCDGNNMTYIDVKGLTKLTYLDCGPNNLSYINGVGSCSSLQTLKCNNNKLTGLEVDKMPALTYLDCSYNTTMTALICYSGNLTTLNVAGNTAMYYLACQDNPNLTSITGLSSCSAMQFLCCDNCGLTDLSGVNSLSKLTELQCKNNKFTELYVDQMPSLTDLDCSNNTTMTKLYCYNDYLTYLNVNGNTALKTLNCANNTNLTSITGLSSCKAITYLDCRFCGLTNLSDANSLSYLEQFRCSNNKLTSLTVTNKGKLTFLSCGNNTKLTELNVSGNALTELIITGNTALETLNCRFNPNLTSITGLSTCSAMKFLECSHCGITDLSDVNSLSNLEMLLCKNNKFTTLEVSNKSKLTYIECSNNSKMTSLGIFNNPSLTVIENSNCAALEEFYCFNNKLIVLYLAGCTALKTLACYNNQLPSLDLSDCPNLTGLACFKNKISGEKMTTLVKSLPMRSASNPGTFIAMAETGEENTMNSYQINVARGKYWKPMIYMDNGELVEYSVAIQGDLNSDGEVSIADVNALINLILAGDTSNPAADVNGDNEVSIADVNALINLILAR